MTLQYVFLFLRFNNNSWRDDLNIAYNSSEPLRITATRGPDNKGYEIYAVDFERLIFPPYFGINIWHNYDVPDLQVIFEHRNMNSSMQNAGNKTFMHLAN